MDMTTWCTSMAVLAAASLSPMAFARRRAGSYPMALRVAAGTGLAVLASMTPASIAPIVALLAIGTVGVVPILVDGWLDAPVEGGRAACGGASAGGSDGLGGMEDAAIATGALAATVTASSASW